MNDTQIHDLKRLMELHENGTLNKFEYETQKNRILGIKRKDNRPLLLGILVFFVLFWYFLTLLSYVENSYYSTSNSKKESISDDTLKQEKIDSNLNIETEVATNPIVINILKACLEANIDPSQVKNIKKETDWINGQRISFYYKGNTFVVYLYENGEVASINRNDFKIYEQGYEALNVDDFILGSTVDVKAKAVENVKSFLKYPRTASFSTFNWRMYKII